VDPFPPYCRKEEECCHSNRQVLSLLRVEKKEKGNPKKEKKGASLFFCSLLAGGEGKKGKSVGAAVTTHCARPSEEGEGEENQGRRRGGLSEPTCSNTDFG